MLERMKSDYDRQLNASTTVGYPISLRTHASSVSSRRVWTTTPTTTACLSFRRGARSRNRRRTQDVFHLAEAFGVEVRRIYERLGYEIVDVPKNAPDARARFVIDA